MQTSKDLAAFVQANLPALREEDDEVICRIEHPAIEVSFLPLCKRDVACLGRGQYLNESVINLYLVSLVDKHLSDTFVFSSFFYKTLAQSRKGVNYATVSRHASWVPLLSKKLLVFIIHGTNHWSMVVARLTPLEGAPPGIELFSLDSLGANPRSLKALRDQLATYLSFVWRDRRGQALSPREPKRQALDSEVELVELPGSDLLEGEEEELFHSITMEEVSVTHQSDFVNCGVHVLRNFELLLSLGARGLDSIGQDGNFADIGFDCAKYRTTIYQALTNRT